MWETNESENFWAKTELASEKMTFIFVPKATIAFGQVHVSYVAMASKV